MSYTQLTQEERYQIYALMKACHIQAKIAEIVGHDPGAISRELRRNRGLKGASGNKGCMPKVDYRNEVALKVISVGGHPSCLLRWPFQVS